MAAEARSRDASVSSVSSAWTVSSSARALRKMLRTGMSAVSYTHLDVYKRQLRAMAEKHGLSSGVWTATGWGGAQLPLDVLVPVYAGYPEGFWEPAEVEWPEFGEMHFRFSEVRDDLSVGADLRAGEVLAPAVTEDRRHPFLTCELGAGMNVSYHRRPHVDPADVAAISVAKLGSGSVWPVSYTHLDVYKRQRPCCGSSSSSFSS